MKSVAHAPCIMGYNSKDRRGGVYSAIHNTLNDNEKSRPPLPVYMYKEARNASSERRCRDVREYRGGWRNQGGCDTARIENRAREGLERYRRGVGTERASEGWNGKS